MARETHDPHGFAHDKEMPRTPPRRPTLGNYLRSAVAIPLIYLYTVVMGTLSLALSLRDLDPALMQRVRDALLRHF